MVRVLCGAGRRRCRWAARGGAGGLAVLAPGGAGAPRAGAGRVDVAHYTPHNVLGFSIGRGSGSVSVFSIGAGGVLAPVTCDPTTICKTGSNPYQVAVDPTGSHLYVTNIAPPSVSVFSIGAGGVLAPVTCDPTTICKTGMS